MALGREYTRRYGKTHLTIEKCRDVLTPVRTCSLPVRLPGRLGRFEHGGGGRRGRCGGRRQVRARAPVRRAVGAEPLSQLRVHHVDDAEMVEHAQPLLPTLLVFVHPLRDGRELARVGTFAQYAHRPQQGGHTRFDAAGRATHHAARANLRPI